MFPRFAVILAVGLLALLAYTLFVPHGAFQDWDEQMQAGSAYMKSLKESDVAMWIVRTKGFLAEYHPGMHSMGVYAKGAKAKPLPSDLAQLKIIEVHIFEDAVFYAWMGGMEHTSLEVRRCPDGTFTLIGHYTDFISAVIWPNDGSRNPAKPCLTASN